MRLHPPAEGPTVRPGRSNVRSTKRWPHPTGGDCVAGRAALNQFHPTNFVYALTCLSKQGATVGGEVLISGGADGVVIFWDETTGQKLTSVRI